VHRILNPPELAPPSGFSHAVLAAGTVYLAGQIGEGDTLVAQFDAAAVKLLAALAAAGGAPRELVSLQVFTTDVGEYKASLAQLGQVWRRRFGDHYPAMGLFGVTELFEPGAKVELMGIAVLEHALLSREGPPATP